ncbi:DUF4149 domain-containing protein [Neisseria montereyensis]|uniref:DUF4149 domain-containing protein n=1 Tax=Neisseria montereyensis TaxID=2973938 RepID=A0ABT2FBL0_9NEIS|nr:DUF4149 domain-containing protein [Neisseria montereyensis]MCS4533360.1 DUF4149 domain-containing protein [Neisseria montereyensis]
MKKWIAVLIGAWLGLQLSAGYLFAPLLFQHLDKIQAGTIAGISFNITSYIGIVVWLLAYIANRSNTRHNYGRSFSGKAIILLLILIIANQFLITPVIDAYRNNTSNWLLSLVGGSFGQWHGTSSIIYMACSLLALILAFRLTTLEQR